MSDLLLIAAICAAAFWANRAVSSRLRNRKRREEMRRHINQTTREELL